jgi:predicted peroxiredoxin
MVLKLCYNGFITVSMSESNGYDVTMVLESNGQGVTGSLTHGARRG